MRIGVDLDGVMVDFQYHWAELYCEYFDRYVSVDALMEYNALISATHFTHISEFYEWFERANGWQNMPWIPGAGGGVDALLDLGHDIRFITARPDEAKPDTESWLWNSPWSSRDGVVDRRVDLRVVGGEKWRHPADIYIDDTPSVIADLLAHDKCVIVFDQPWNRDLDDLPPHQPGALRRAFDWHTVVSIIKENT